MAEASSQAEGPIIKRRKVRKGTQSCWECRRRRVRCNIAIAGTATCDNCKRRGTACISQEYADELTSPGGSSRGQVRLSRAEDSIKHHVNRAAADHLPNSPAKDHDTVESYSSTPPPKKHIPIIVASSIQSSQAPGKYEELSQALIAVWPSQRDIDLICSLPVGLSAQLQCGICTPYSRSISWDSPSPQDMLQLPPPGSHPVLIARKLLTLGVFLQGVLPSCTKGSVDPRESYRDVMFRVVDTAIRLVTTNEDLIVSVEGIDCIMIEAMYKNYAGSLHHAWMAVRRATNVAQVMALDRGINSSYLKFLDPATRPAFNPDQICFRLVEMDRYLSLVLGLPCTTLKIRFEIPESLEKCQPIDRLQRVHCIMADRILQRNDTDLEGTRDIDNLLQKAAAEMPPQWWLMPNLLITNSGGTEILHETVRLMDQFSHYHLLTRLHLPYVLRSAPDRRYDHSKITAVNASRDTLARFIAFRTSNPAHYYCRGTDFLAFIASTVMCLAYINSHSPRQAPDRHLNPGDVFETLLHSRASDRGMMERTLDIMESMVQADTDVIATKISRILHHLLAMESNAAKGTSYSMHHSQGDEEELECHGKFTKSGERLSVHIPYFGAINFHRKVTTNPVLTTPTAPQRLFQSGLATDVFSSDVSAQVVPPPQGNGVSTLGSDLIHDGYFPAWTGSEGVKDDWDLDDIDMVLFETLVSGEVLAEGDGGNHLG